MLTRARNNKTFYELELERLAEKQPLKEYQYVAVRCSKAFMDAHYHEKIELDRISSYACMSLFHYIRIFRQVYGVTPRAYLKDVRISKARQLLGEGRTVSEVCYKVGYDSLQTFSSAFKRATGNSPVTYKIKSNRG